jgi:hypothetical protein
VDARQLRSWHGDHPERIGVAEIVLAREREVAQLVEAPQILGLGVGEPVAIERYPLLDLLDEPAKAVELELGEPLARKRLELRLEDHPSSITFEDAIVTQ